MQQLTPSAAAQAITLAGKLNKPIMLWSGPGIGKSSIIQQLATDNGDQIVDIRLSQWDTVDFNAA